MAFGWVAVLGAVSGAISLIVFQRLTDRERLRQTANRIVAHFLEIQLFATEAGLVLRAQRDLIVENGRILGQFARPLLMLLLPFWLLLAGLELFFGRAPLRPGQTALVTVQFRNQESQARLVGSASIDVDAPPVSIPVERQIVWRVRARTAATGELRISADGTTIGKSISAGTGFVWLSPLRTGSIIQFLRHPGEWPFTSKTIDSIEIGYRPATIFGVQWLVWFCLSSLLGATLFALFT